MQKALHKKLISLFLLFGILSLIAFVLTAYFQYCRLFNAQNNLVISYQTIRAANQSLISIDEAALNVSTFAQSKDPDILVRILNIIIAAEVNFSTLSQLIQDNKNQRALLNVLTPLFENKINFLNAVLTTMKNNQVDQALQMASDRDRLRSTREIEKLIIQIKQYEISQLEETNERLKIFRYETTLLLTALGLLMGFLFFCFFMLLNQYFKTEVE